MAKGKGGFLGHDGLNAPDAPTGVSGTAGDAQVTVSWTAPSDVGGSAITGYNVVADDGSSWYYAYSIANASYDSVSFSVSGQETAPRGLAFSNDGTKMFITGPLTDNVYQYSLSTAFDLSTASYDSVSFSVASQDVVPNEIVFNNDGTKLYVCGSDTDSVYQYSLSTAFDLSTASYDSVSFSVASQDVVPFGLAFNNDGTKMYMVGGTNALVYQYSLSTGFDLSTASYDSVSFDPSSQAPSPRGITFNADGTKVYIVGIDNQSVYQYSLSTAFNLSSVSYDSISFSFSSQDSSPFNIAFNDTGSKMYMIGYGNDAVYQYTTGSGADYPTASPVTITGLTNGTSYTFNVWAINAFGWSVASDATGTVTPVTPTIALFAGGENTSGVGVNTIDTVTIDTLGNATDFGDLSSASDYLGAVSSSTRGVFGGINGTVTIDYVTIASAGNASDFGDLLSGRDDPAGAGSSTRGLFFGGFLINVIEYITIASTGNSTDFGDLLDNLYGAGACASPTRALVGGGSTGSDTNVIQYVTIASTGNATDFGDRTVTKNNVAAASNSTRGIFAGGWSVTNVMDYVTIATTGNAVDFGDLTVSRAQPAGTSSASRAIFGGGTTGGSGKRNEIDYVTIASTGNAIDFGDLTVARAYLKACSSAHGGIS